MSAPHTPEQTVTGVKAIDCVRYRRAPAALSLTFADRDIVLYRITDYGASAMTKAERPADDHDLLLLTRGSGIVPQGRIAGERFRFGANRELRATLVPQGADASVEFGTSARSLNILFPKDCLSGMLEDRARRQPEPVLFSNNPSLIGFITQFELALFRPGLASDLAADHAIRSIAVILCGLDPHGVLTAGDHVWLSPRRLRRVTDFIEANLGDHLTLEMMAGIAGLSVFHFTRVFRNATGTSPYRYVIKRRMLRAQQMLMTDHYRIQDVALACGFSDHASFSAAFARARGVSPSRYRTLFAM